MENRTAAVIITIVVVLLCAFPGLASICVGLLALLEIIINAIFNSYVVTVFGYNAPYWAIAGLCIGLLGIAIAVIVSVLVLRRKKAAPLSPPSPTPPPTPDEPLPPTI